MIAISVLALAVLGALPWILRWSQLAGWGCLAAVFAWSVWLMVLYLKWARRLGR